MGIEEPLLGSVATANRSTGTESSCSSRRDKNRNKQKPPPLPLVDTNGNLNVEQKGFPKTILYWGDMFHTLVNMPNTRFTLVLFLAYFLLFVVFAIPYYLEAIFVNSIPGVNSFTHAVWFSVQTSMTIGYGGDLTPSPDYFLTNAFVTIQSITSLLMAYSLLGVVYARFSRPTKRASTIVFSHRMVVNNEEPVPCISFRIGNIRKHQLIEASVRMLVAFNNLETEEDESVFRFISLQIQGGEKIFLGLPCIVSHPLVYGSPLHDFDENKMRKCDLEILILLEAVDASTSSKLQARYSYRPEDIKFNYRFSCMVNRTEAGRRCVDFSKFHEIFPIPPTSDAYLLSYQSETSMVESSSFEDLPQLQKRFDEASGDEGKQLLPSSGESKRPERKGVSRLRRVTKHDESTGSRSSSSPPPYYQISGQDEEEEEPVVSPGVPAIVQRREVGSIKAEASYPVPDDLELGIKSQQTVMGAGRVMMQKRAEGAGGNLAMAKKKKSVHRDPIHHERRRRRGTMLSQLLIGGPNTAALQVLEYTAEKKVNEAEARAQEWRHQLMELATQVIQGDPDKARVLAVTAVSATVSSVNI